ncbi:MAG: DsbA family oxidoreductase [Rhodospirillales bacterium]|nr:MAG: DsbA family oxidoreductase [Rhodospirillales bacterium]
MIVDVFADPICPWCYIGKRRLEKALDQFERADDVFVRWRAFQLNPGMPREGMRRDEYLAVKFGGAERAREIYDAIREAGKTVGISFAFEKIRRTPNTVQAHRLIRHSAQSDCHDKLVERLFRAYFLEGRDLGDETELIDIASECGMDVSEARRLLAGQDGQQDVLAEHDFAVSLNITGVPCFIVEGRYAVVGAQEADAFGPIFDLVDEEARTAAVP